MSKATTHPAPPPGGRVDNFWPCLPHHVPWHKKRRRGTEEDEICSTLRGVVKHTVSHTISVTTGIASIDPDIKIRNPLAKTVKTTPGDYGTQSPLSFRSIPMRRTIGLIEAKQAGQQLAPSTTLTNRRSGG